MGVTGRNVPGTVCEPPVYVWPDDELPVLLLTALSARYRSLCFVIAWEEPDTFEGWQHADLARACTKA